MITLSIIFGLISILNSIIAYLPTKFSEGKQWLSTWFLKKCIKLQPFNNDQLVREVKPLMYVVGLFFFFLSIIVIKLRGSEDIESEQITIAWTGVFLFITLGLITYNELIDRLKKAVKVGFNFVLWLAGVLVVVTLIVVLLFAIYQANLTNQPIDFELITQLIVATLADLGIRFGLALLILASFLFMIIFLIPFLINRAFLWFVRKVINFIIANEQKDPLKIPLLISSIFFMAIAIYSYLTK